MNKLLLVLILAVSLFSKEKPLVDTTTFETAKLFKQKFIEKSYTLNTAHFRVNYDEGLETQAREVAKIAERLYSIYKDKYGINLPHKTEILVADAAITNGWALALQNTIAIWIHDLDWNLRGNPNWLENVVAHEYAHIASISTSFKMPYWMPYLQLGYSSNSNKQARTDALYIYPNEILPPWFFEGIAQYESSQQHGDSWDSHRDMVLRELTLNDALLTWNQMSVFNGRFDNYEKTYDHGFALVKYIAEKYGYDKVVAILRESSRFGRMIFDNSIKAVLGISGKELYKEWTTYLKQHYIAEVDSLGDTTSGQIINKEGYNNFWPKFSNDEKKIYYLSNENRDNGRMYLYSYNMIDTVPDSTAFRLENPKVNHFYSISPDGKNVLSFSAGIPNKFVDNFRWRDQSWDIFIDTLFPDSVKKIKHKTKYHHQLTKMDGRVASVYSPDGKMIASVQIIKDRATLSIASFKDKKWHQIYPPKDNDTLKMHSIYSIDWSPDGKMIALSYLDRDNRKVGIYFLEDSTFKVIPMGSSDSRDARFSKDSKKLYFSSDREHKIFNIFRYNLEDNTLEQLTNTVGCAFTPDINEDETRLLYSTFTKDGYQIYLADSFKVLHSEILQLQGRKGYVPDTNLPGGTPHKYNPFPRKVLVIPTLISEEVLTDPKDPYKGIRDTKFGAIVQLVDPLFWRQDRGNSLTFFYLTNSYFKKWADMFGKGGINRNAPKMYATDAGIMGTCDVFPFNMSLSYFKRNLPSTNEFVHNSYGYDTLEQTNYALQPGMFQFKVDYPIGMVNLSYFYSNFNYDLQVDIGTEPGNSYFGYTPSKNNKNGIIASYTATNYTKEYNISPHRTVAKLQYDFNSAKYIDPNEGLVIKDGRIVENYDSYKFSTIKGAIKKARATLLNPKVDVEWGFNGSYLIENTSSSNEPFPQLYMPSLQVPGYTYYYQGDSTMHILYDRNDNIDTVYTPSDTILAAGKAMITAQLAYRFPIYPGVIDKKFWFLYLDRFYGAINGGGVLAKNSGTEILHSTFDDWLFYAGAELRLSTIAFNSYPMAIRFRWDQGLNRDKPIGGARFTFSLGFEFDNWTIITEPDGIEGRYTPSYLQGR